MKPEPTAQLSYDLHQPRHRPALTYAIVLLASTLFVSLFPAGALAAKPASLYDLSTRNSTILTGKVVDSHSYWNSDGSWIVTDYRVSPGQVIKGAVMEQELILTMIGGRVGETTVLIPGAPLLEIGKSYLLFVNEMDLPGAAGAKTLTNHTQSVFDIVATEQGPRAISQAAPRSPASIGDEASARGQEGLALDTLVEAIRAVVRQPTELAQVQSRQRKP